MIPKYVTIPLDLFEPLPVSHSPYFSNLSNSSSPVQEAIVKVYVVHFLVLSNLEVKKKDLLLLLFVCY